MKGKSRKGIGTIAGILMAATEPVRIEWYFNNMRARHALPPNARSLLGSGSSQNEALHHQMNTWFRNQPELHRTTLQMQLDVNRLGKLIAHNSAAYSPTLRQLDPQTVLNVIATQLEVGNSVGLAGRKIEIGCFPCLSNSIDFNSAGLVRFSERLVWEFLLTVKFF